MDESRARALLRAERTEIETLLREAGADVDAERESAEGPGDFGDAAEPLEEEASNEAISATLEDRLGAIDRALARLEAGTYGRSVISGKPISDERLAADPAAELTVEEARAQR